MRVTLQWLENWPDLPSVLDGVPEGHGPGIPSARGVVETLRAQTHRDPWVLQVRMTEPATVVVTTGHTTIAPASLAPWSDPHWRNHVAAWIADHIGSHTLVQHRVWGRSTVIEVLTHAGTLWFKESYGLPPGEGAALALARAQTVPGFTVPECIALDGTRALMKPLAGVPLPEAKPAVWADAIAAVVRFQRNADVDAWRAAGCWDLSQIDWTEQLHRLFERYEQPVRWVPALAARLETLSARPMVVLPWDLGPCNLQWLGDGVQAYDWSDVVIGPPGMLLDRWLNECDTPARREAVTQAWLDAWGGDAAQMWQDTRRCALLLEVLRYDRELDWLDPLSPPAPHLRAQNRAQLERQLQWCDENLSPD